MKKIIQLSLLLSFSFNLYAQQAICSYINIIKSFCTDYTPSEDYENYTWFAKKKDGWYVIQVNKVDSDKVLDERLFYSIQENKYMDLHTYYQKPNEPDLEKQLERFLNFGGGTFDWYNYDRIAYYGYNGWENDMLQDFGSREDISDSMYEGLARAYGNLASSYLWYQQGGIYLGNDTLHRKLERLEYPSAQRISKVKEAIDNSIMKYRKLARISPMYQTVVGNSRSKLFNQYMFGYNQMMMCGNDQQAKEYLASAPLEEPYIIQAKNYLNSCEQNAILFTFGDNDTYQLWYVQEKFNYRKDISVINTSLLGLPIYIDMLSRKKILLHSVPGSFLKQQSSDYTYFLEDKKITGIKAKTSLKEFLKSIYTKQYPASSIKYIYSTYPYSSVTLSLPGTNAPVGAAPKIISFDLEEKGFFLNDIAMFDIILNNSLKRPVYFSSSSGLLFEKNLVQKGIVYKLVAEDINSALQSAAEIKALEKFVNEKYQPVLSNDSLLSFDGDNTFFATYYRIFNYYLGKEDAATFKKWLHKLNTICPKIHNEQMNAAKSLPYYFIEADDTERGLALIDQYAIWYNKVYSNPSSLKGFHIKETYKRELTKTRDYLAKKKLHSTVLDNFLNQ